MKLSLHFGAGCIGRGYLTPLLQDSGYKVIFVESNANTARLINKQNSYAIQVYGKGNYVREIRGVKAIDPADISSLSQYLAKADLITTAVGPSNLPSVAASIVESLKENRAILNNASRNIIACENMWKASSKLKELILEHLPQKMQAKFIEHVGFIDSEVSKLVLPLPLPHDPLAVITEEYSEFVMEENGSRGDPPQIIATTVVRDVTPYIARKMYTLAVHATGAYLGYQKGYKYVCQAFCNPDIIRVVKGILQEIGKVLIKEFHLPPREYRKYAETLLERHSDKRLEDLIIRVTREPIRKLGPNERFILPARMVLQYGVVPKFLTKGIIAVLRSNCLKDSQSVELNRILAKHGIEFVLCNICKLRPGEQLFELIKKEWQETS